MIKVLEGGETLKLGPEEGGVGLDCGREIVATAAKDEVGRVVGVMRAVKKGEVDVEKGEVKYLGKER